MGVIVEFLDEFKLAILFIVGVICIIGVFWNFEIGDATTETVSIVAFNQHGSNGADRICDFTLVNNDGTIDSKNNVECNIKILTDESIYKNNTLEIKKQDTTAWYGLGRVTRAKYTWYRAE